MTQSFQADIISFDERELSRGTPLVLKTLFNQQHNEFVTKRIFEDNSFDTKREFYPGEHQFWIQGHNEKIKGIGFPFNKPWLPPKVLKLLNKLKKSPITEKELVNLMELVAQRSSDHFQLEEGKFVAVTFHGKIVEVSTTRVGLLKKIQNKNYREEIFVWKTGAKAFSGRI